MRGMCGIEWVSQLYNPFGERAGGWSIVPRVREARPWAVECNPFGVKTKTTLCEFGDKNESPSHEYCSQRSGSLGQVIQVSVETVKIVAGLPEAFAG